MLGFLVCRTAGYVKTGMGAEGPTTSNLEAVFPWFPFVLKQMLRQFPSCYSVLLKQPFQIKIQPLCYKDHQIIFPNYSIRH
jgi:hypothetical protein